MNFCYVKLVLICVPTVLVVWCHVILIVGKMVDVFIRFKSSCYGFVLGDDVFDIVFTKV